MPMDVKMLFFEAIWQWMCVTL